MRLDFFFKIMYGTDCGNQSNLTTEKFGFE